MFRVIRVLLFLSLAGNIFISICYATEDVVSTDVELNCEVLESSNSRILRDLILCIVSDQNSTINNDTKFVVKENPGQDFTGFTYNSGNIPVLTGKIFTEIVKTFPNVIDLDLSNNKMTQIKNNTFKFQISDLLELSLDRNKLTEITEFMFGGAENLISLNLDHNEIEFMSPKAFHSVPKLESLRISHNMLSTLDKEVFKPLKVLKVLEMADNRLSFVDPQLFIYNAHLSVLNLGENKFREAEIELSTTQMELMSFYGSEFQRLSLRNANNSREIITIDALYIKFSQLSALSDLEHIDSTIHVKRLDIGINSITSLSHPPSFVRHVVELDVSSLPIDEISTDFFEKFVSLRELSIGSALMRMRPNMFEALEDLKVLHLMFNEAINIEWFNGLSNLEELRLVGIYNWTSFDYMGLLNTLPALKMLEIRGHNFNCNFMKRLMKDLKTAGRFNVISYRGFEKVGERGFRFFGKSCSF